MVKLQLRKGRIIQSSALCHRNPEAAYIKPILSVVPFGNLNETYCDEKKPVCYPDFFVGAGIQFPGSIT
jgi:hypothetical protein